MLLWLIGTGWFVLTPMAGAVMWASQVGPDQAVSNLYLWAQKLGIKDPPQWLKDKSADRKIRWRAMLALACLLFVGGFLAGDAYRQYFGAELISTGPQLARLRIHYVGNNPYPVVNEAENVLSPPISLQWGEDGVETTGQIIRKIKWTMLILIFEKPVTGTNFRILPEGGDILVERQVLKSRYATISF